MKDTQMNLGIRVLPRFQALGIVSRTEVDRLIGSGQIALYDASI